MARKASDLRLVTVTQLARDLGMHPDTLRRKVRRGEGPPAIRFGASHVFRLATVRQWLAEQERGSSAADTRDRTEPARNPEDHK